MKRILVACVILTVLFSSCTFEHDCVVHPVVDEMMGYLDLDKCKLTNLGTYSAFMKETCQITVSQEEIEERIKTILESEEIITPITRTVIQDGDLVSYTWHTEWNGKVIDKPTSSRMKIGSGGFNIDIEQKLIGSHVGQEKRFNITLPNEMGLYGYLAGKCAEICIMVEYIYSVTYPMLSDEYVQKYFGCRDIQECYNNIRDLIYTEKETQLKKSMQQDFIQKIIKESTFELDHNQIIQFAKKLALGGISTIIGYGYTVETYEEYLIATYGTVDEYYSQCYELAKSNTCYYLIIGAIAYAENLNVTDSEFRVGCSSLGIDEATASTEDKSYVWYYLLEKKTWEYIMTCKTKEDYNEGKDNN